jgi:protein-tyrosine phosphatase
VIDLHVHLLPGVDDGPADTAAAVAMCRAAAADGIEVTIATPHQRHPLWPGLRRTTLEARHAELSTAMAVGNIIDVRLGAELRADSELVGDLEHDGDGLLSLAGSRYLLVELDPIPVGPDPRDLVNELAVAGWRPVVAHPERIPWLVGAVDLLAEMVGLGATLQLTGMAVTGELGRRSHDCCRTLLDRDLAHFVGSDGHNLQMRPPTLSRSYDAVRAGWGADTAERLFVTNPRAVLDDRPLD